MPEVKTCRDCTGCEPLGFQVHHDLTGWFDVGRCYQMPDDIISLNDTTERCGYLAKQNKGRGIVVAALEGKGK